MTSNPTSNDDGELRNIFAECGSLGDEKRFADFAQLFATDGLMVVAGVPQARGPAAIHDWLAARSVPAGRHFTANVWVEVTGNEASGRCSFLFVTPDNAIAAVGVFQMCFAREGGRWKILEWRAD